MTENEQIEEMAAVIEMGRMMSAPSNLIAETLVVDNGYRKVERGEWELNIDGSHWCSVCGHNATYTYDGTEVCGVSCPFCGADMRKEDEGK